MSGFSEIAPRQVYNRIQETITGGTFDGSAALKQIGLLVE